MFQHSKHLKPVFVCVPLKREIELNDTETKRTIQRIKKSRSCFFEKISKINKPSIRLIKKKKERTQINKIRNKRGEITTNTTEIQRTVRNYYKLYAKKLDNLGEMEKFLDTYNLPKLNQEEAESLNRLITICEIEAVIKKPLAHKSPGPDSFRGKFYQTFRRELTPCPSQTIPKNSRRWKTPKIFLWGQYYPHSKTR